MARKKEVNLTLEDTLEQLGTVVQSLERGDLPLEEALNAFEQGIKLVNAGQAKLQQAEQRIQILMNKDENAPLADFTPAQHFSDEPF